MARVLLDLDGTLVNSEPFYLKKGEQALQTLGLAYAQKNLASGLAFNLYINQLSLPLREKFWDLFDALDTRWNSIDSAITLYPDALQFLEQLPARPFIVTNTPYKKAWNEVRHFGLEKYIMGMECAEKESGKPKPDLALMALGRMKGDGPVFIVGDAETETELAVNLQEKLKDHVYGILVQRQQEPIIPCEYRVSTLLEALALILDHSKR